MKRGAHNHKGQTHRNKTRNAEETQHLHGHPPLAKRFPRPQGPSGTGATAGTNFWDRFWTDDRIFPQSLMDMKTDQEAPGAAPG